MFVLLLVLATAVCLGAAWQLWLKSRSLAFPLGIAVLYFWSIHGGWLILADHAGLTDRALLDDLSNYIVAPDLDVYYAKAILLYSCFIVGVAGTALVGIRPSRFPCTETAAICLSHRYVLAISAVSGLLSYLIVARSLKFAAVADQSVYLITRTAGEVGSLYTLHLQLNEVALLSGSIGLATAVSGNDAKYIVGVEDRSIRFAYVLVLGALMYYCFLLGNRSQLLTAAIPGCLFYLANARRPRVVLLGGVSCALFAAIVAVGVFRGFGASSLSENFSWALLWEGIQSLGGSSESLAAHTSMYAVLEKDCPPTMGTSFLSLIASVVPRFLWPDRPAEIYDYYASSIGLAAGRGYTIHHAAGWYLNFGSAGVIIGAILVGAIWAKLYNYTQRGSSEISRLMAVPARVGFFIFCGVLPSVLRAGPECYKAVFVATIFVPTLALYPACSHRRFPSDPVQPPEVRRSRTPNLSASGILRCR